MQHRFNIIQGFCKGKKIADIGFLGGKKRRFSELHDFLTIHNPDVIGIDIDKERVAKMKKAGHNVVYGDAENLKLKSKVDVIVAGEIIEHLWNAGNFLESCSRNLKKNGLLILTTPNCFGIRYILRLILFGFFKIKEQHTCWYDMQTLEHLTRRYYVTVEKHHTFNSSGWRYFVERAFSFIHKEFASTLLIVLMKK